MSPQVKNAFDKTLRDRDFNGNNTDLNDSEFLVVESHQVDADQRKIPGNGRIDQGVDDRGTFTFDAQDGTPDPIEGDARVIVEDSNGNRTTFIREDTLSDLRAGVRMGKGGQRGTESTIIGATEDQFIKVAVRSAQGSVTYNASNSTIRMPIRQQNL